MNKSIIKNTGKNKEYTAEIFSDIKNKIEAEVLKNKLIRSLNSAAKMAVLIEVEAPLKPNIVNGKQLGWYAEDSLFQVAIIDKVNDPQEYVELVSMLGFNPKIISQDNASSVDERLGEIIKKISCSDHLYLSYVNQRYFILQAESGASISETDAVQVLNFNKSEYGFTCRDVPFNDYIGMFQLQGNLIIGSL